MFIEDLHKALRRGSEGVMRPLLPPGYGVEAGLLRGRVHEFCGSARQVLAALVMQADPAPAAPVLWIAPAWLPGGPHPAGLAPFTDAGRVILARPRRAVDILWTMEEALRSGEVPLVLAEVTAAPH
ncbi:MAG: hypothetical protein ACK4GW_13150 [Pseudorhodobacter sp.]